jgi:hypothetical protein
MAEEGTSAGMLSHIMRAGYGIANLPCFLWDKFQVLVHELLNL